MNPAPGTRVPSGLNSRHTYQAAAATFADLAARVSATQLAGPGLGDWSVRELLGHIVSSGLSPVSPYDGQQPDLAAPSAYFAVLNAASLEEIQSVNALTTQNARKIGLELGEDPGPVVSRRVETAMSALKNVDDEDLVATPVGSMRLRDWLPTRTLELVVHSSDIAVATGLEVDFPADALSESAALVARGAAVIGAGLPVLQALTGRDPLPAGFSMVL